VLNDFSVTGFQMKKLVILSGAGISAESGLKTFRDSDGLWENFRIEEVATPGAWIRNRQLVLDFYNDRRRQVRDAQPNAAHVSIARLEEKFKVTVITQNIDDLHERAGSSNVVHLHGEIFKSRSTADPSLIYTIEGTELNEGDRCEKGSQLRPHIVWFGEMVPTLPLAATIVSSADIFIVVGTSLAVYPAAGLTGYAPPYAEKYIVDPAAVELAGFTAIRDMAGKGIPSLAERLLKNET
jgi:NAD-dependent deacetylase